MSIKFNKKMGNLGFPFVGFFWNFMQFGWMAGVWKLRLGDHRKFLTSTRRLHFNYYRLCDIEKTNNIRAGNLKQFSEY
jgi:hypothetical protein